MKPTINTKFITILFSLLFFSITLSAKEVPLKTASQVALNVFSEKAGLAKTSIEIKEVIPVEDEGVVLYRIFNFIPTGYIIVTADDNAEPLIGYGLDSNFNFDDTPPALLFLLRESKQEMVYIIKNELKADKNTTAKWERFSSENYMPLKSYTVGSYLLNTSWNQRSPYNNSCPLDPNTGNRCPVGCTAVALGQILNYWNCKVFPDGTRTYYPNVYFTNPLSVNFYDQDYDWDNMTTVPSETAKLLYHCGVAIQVDYSDSVTSGYNNSVKYAMENNFGFQTSGLKSKSSYSSSTWINMLKADIDAGRPVYYAGIDTTVTPNTAHAWVIDGYKATDEFHCNWGWGGSHNDFYYLTNLTPPSHNYNSNQLAILGAEPILDACSGLSVASVICSSNITYSVSIPTTASVLWSKSTNINQVGGNTGLTFTVNAGSSGSGNITATIKNSQGQTFLTRTKDVWVGGPKIDYISGPTYTPNNDWATYYAQPNNSQMAATDYEWALSPTNGNVIYDYGWTADIAFYNAGNYQLVARAQNTCGWGPYTVLGLEVYDSKSLAISPNPTTGETTITINPASEKELLVSAWDLEIFTPTQALKEKKTRLKGSSTVINTAGWQEGVYVVRVLYNNEVITGKLIVKR